VPVQEMDHWKAGTPTADSQASLSRCTLHVSALAQHNMCHMVTKEGSNHAVRTAGKFRKAEGVCCSPGWAGGGGLGTGVALYSAKGEEGHPNVTLILGRPCLT
jgi:hypothetical protein